ncbi:MAG: hypothetical protein GEU78_11040 [Actinobacteria bacterium]|nr:hypothetical protein [Actinomycetota bacterium]
MTGRARSMSGPEPGQECQRRLFLLLDGPDLDARLVEDAVLVAHLEELHLLLHDQRGPGQQSCGLHDLTLLRDRR